MRENDNINMDKEEKEEGGFSIVKAIGYLRSYWKLFVLSFVVCISFATMKLRRATPVYQVTAKVLLQDSEKGGAVSSPADMLADFGMEAQTSNIENEIQLMASMAVVREAVIDSDLFIKYRYQGKLLHKNASPFIVTFDKDALPELQNSIKLEFKIGKGEVVTLSCTYNGETKSGIQMSAYPFVLQTPAGNVTIERNDGVALVQGNLVTSVMPVGSVAGKYKGGLSIAPLSKTASVAVLAYNTPVPAEGVDFLNALMDGFNKVTNENKRQVARRTEAFISNRLSSLSVELEEMESNLAAYKKQNELIDSKLDVTQVTQRKAEYVKMLELVDLKIEASKYLNDFVNDPKNDMQLLPTSLGVELDQALVTLIANYNAKVLERKALLQSSTDENPTLKASTAVVSAMQDDLRAALKALDQSLTIERKSVAMLADKYTDRFEMSPEIERKLISITRECSIKSDLYVMLLQKYEETLLSIEVTSDNLSCIDAPGLAGLVSPNKRMTYMVAIFMAFVIPAAYIYIRTKMRNKFDSVEEIQEKLDVSFVGSIPMKKSRRGFGKSNTNPIVVQKNVNDVMAEAFRTLRTNLQFVMRKSSGKVIMFTSTVSGEGKTFIASNLAVSTALLGKKVLLVGCDIRRPRLAEVFNFSAGGHGLTSYLAAPEDDVAMLDGFIIPSNVADGLDLLPAGIVPPNPAELLSGSNLDRAIEYLKRKYDYIILDAAPVGLVADSMIVNRVADTVVYVTRLNYTHKADAEFIASLIADKKLENVSIVVNGENMNGKTYGSRGSHRYSSYGYSYLDESKKKWWKIW